MNTQKSNQQNKSGKSSKAIVLVHGGFVDGSGWAAVYQILKSKGYNVVIVQNATKSLADDVATTKAAIDSVNSDVVLVGHSYGGVVITEAGTHSKVSDLVYITAFAPDKGESVSSLIANPPPGAPVPPILPPKDGYLFLDRTKFAAGLLSLPTLSRTTASFVWPRFPGSPGASRRSQAQSPNQGGKINRATISLRRRTR